MKIYRNLFLKPFLILLLLHINSFSQPVSDTLTVNQDDSNSKERGWLVFPFASYTPETEWAFGAVGLVYFYNNPISQESRLSNLLTSFQFTTKKQMTIDLIYDLYFKNDEYRFYGSLGYTKFPFSFFGTGNNTKKENEEIYTPRYIVSENTFIKNFIRKGAGGLNAGIRYDFRKERIIDMESHGLLSSGNYKEIEGGIISGFGLIVNWDTRDNTFSTFSGEYFEAIANFYGSYIFGDYNYNSYYLDVREYFNFPVLGTVHVFAAQFAVNFTTGSIPFYKLPTFGGDRAMRGIFLGRYRDINSFYLQPEYRFHLVWRIGLAAFASVGEVAPKVSLFSLKEIKAAYGTGIRLSLIPEEKIIARIDIGFSGDGNQIYFSLSEAF